MLQNCLVRCENGVFTAVVGDFGLAEKIPDYRSVPPPIPKEFWSHRSQIPNRITAHKKCFFPRWYKELTCFSAHIAMHVKLNVKEL